MANLPALSDYLNRITSEHSNRPKFIAFVTALLQPMLDAQAFFSNLITDFDIDTAVGVQLDAVGEWIGRSRNISIPLAGIFFSLDEVGLGFDQGSWKGPFDPDSGLTALDDESYRALLKAKRIMNSWDGSIPVAAQAISALFQESPNTIITIQDNQDMTMTVSIGGQVPPLVILSILQGGYLPISPEGVGVNYVVTSVNGVALFGFDADNATIGGFDEGSWGGVPGTASGPVLGFSIVSVTPTSVTLSWLAPNIGSGPFTYQAMFQLGAGGNAFALVGGIINGTTTTISNLQPGTIYTFAVFPINSSGPGALSSPQTTTTSGGAPAQVTGLVITATAQASITLAWNAVTGNNIQYQLQFRPADPTNSTPFALFGPRITTTSEIVTGLAVGSYDFQVFAINAFSSGPPSLTVTGGTASANPGVVQQLQVATVGTNDISLSWLNPLSSNGPFTFTVQVAQNITPLTFQTYTTTPITVTSTGGSVDVQALVAGQSYQFRVQAANLAGSGPISAPVTATANEQPATAPASLTLSSFTGTTATFAWPSSFGSVTYQMEAETMASGVWVNIGSPTSSLTITISGLTTGTAYNFRVHGLTADNIPGPPSPPVAVVTTGSVPGQVPSLVISAPTNSTLTATWAAPSTGDGTPTYQVNYRLTGTILTWTPAGAPISALTAIISGLQSGLEYDIEIVPINDFGFGTASAVANGTTLSVPSTVTWSATDHTSNIFTSGDLLTATAFSPPVTNLTASGITASSLQASWTAANAAGFFGIRGNGGTNKGKVYLEFSVVDATVDFTVGIATPSWNYNTSLLGSDTFGLGIKISNQSSLINGVSLSGAGTVSDISGATVSLALDLNNRLYWYATDHMRAVFGPNAWNNSATANPATGTGGLPMSGLAVDIYYPAFSDLEASSACKINTGGTAFVRALPASFNAFGGVGAASIGPPVQVSGVVAGAVSNNSVSLSWSAVNTSGGPFSSDFSSDFQNSSIGPSPNGYQVMYRKTGSSGPFYKGPLIIGQTTSAVVSNLLAGVSYDFIVFGFNGGGYGAPSTALTKSTTASASPVLTYRGLNIKGADLTAIATLPTSFPHANSVIIPVFCSTASQTSTDVVLSVTASTIAGWIDAAVAAGFEVFLAVYVTPRDGSPANTITPGPSFAGVQTFFNNLQVICTQMAQIGDLHTAIGMFCGVACQPWAGFAAGDTGPFNSVHEAQWIALYNSCKSIWPTGIISYSAIQTSLGLTTQNSPWSVDWSIWDAIGIELFPGSSNSFELTSAFQNFFDTAIDPDPATVASVGQTPLITALANYSSAVGLPLIITQCGIIPADGNQVAPQQQAVLPPPFNYSMQSAWWQAIMNELASHIANIVGFFAWDGGATLFNSTFNGIDYYGIGGTISAPVIDLAYSNLIGATSPLTAPTGLTPGVRTNTTIAVSWTGVAGTNIQYVLQWSPSGANTWTSLPAQIATSATIGSGLQAATFYDIRVFAIQGTTNGPFSAVITVETTGTAAQNITINNLGTVTANAVFTVTGILAGFTSVPSLDYADDALIAQVSGITETETSTSITVNWAASIPPSLQALPAGSVVGLTSFSFIHPALAAGTHTLTMTNGTVIASITFTVH